MAWAGTRASALALALCVLLERTELICPEAFHLLQPVAQRAKRLWLQAVHSNTSVIRLCLILHQTLRAEQPEMAAQRGGTDVQHAGKLARAPRRGAQEIDHRTARGICERRQRGVHFVHSVYCLPVFMRWLNHQWCPPRSTAS